MLNKQDLKNLLKEKEKGCTKYIQKGYSSAKCGDSYRRPSVKGRNIYCKKCYTEISILKQALEAIENERKEILNKIRSEVGYYVGLTINRKLSHKELEDLDWFITNKILEIKDE